MAFKNGERLWAVVPAAGQGKRLGGAVPKQYLEIAGLSVLAHSLNRLAAVEQIDDIFVGISKTDKHWQTLPLPDDTQVVCYTGGQCRAETVWLGLQALQGCAAADDWVLVHDAARPCVRIEDIDTLISKVVPSFEAGLLAVPVTDTIKIANQDSTADQTMDRRMLWRAQTPQLFRFPVLFAALQAVAHNLESIPDESAAVERLGLKPLIVQSAGQNIKITNSRDLQLAEFLLGEQS